MSARTHTTEDRRSPTRASRQDSGADWRFRPSSRLGNTARSMGVSWWAVLLNLRGPCPPDLLSPVVQQRPEFLWVAVGGVASDVDVEIEGDEDVLEESNDG